MSSSVTVVSPDFLLLVKSQWPMLFILALILGLGFYLVGFYKGANRRQRLIITDPKFFQRILAAHLAHLTQIKVSALERFEAARAVRQQAILEVQRLSRAVAKAESFSDESHHTLQEMLGEPLPKIAADDDLAVGAPEPASRMQQTREDPIEDGSPAADESAIDFTAQSDQPVEGTQPEGQAQEIPEGPDGQGGSSSEQTKP